MTFVNQRESPVKLFWFEYGAGLRHYSVDSELTVSNDPKLTPKTTDDSHTIGSLALVYHPRKDLTWRVSWAPMAPWRL